MKIDKDFIKTFIHQIDNRPSYSFTSSQLCLRSVKWIFFIDQVFEIESFRLGRLLLGRWVGGRLVGGSVSKRLVVGWSVVGGSVVGGFNNTLIFPPFVQCKIIMHAFISLVEHFQSLFLGLPSGHISSSGFTSAGFSFVKQKDV